MESTEFNEAMAAAQQNKLHSWVVSFLRSNGNNPGLADKLEKDGHFYFGPLDFPIKDIENILGPDTTYKYQEEPQSLNARIEIMAKNIEAGWRPPPLIVTNFWEDYLELADGGHRYWTFERLGIEMYPTIFYFKNKATMDDFLRAL